MAYCPRCGSVLYSIDESYMAQHGVCSACVTWNRGAADGREPPEPDDYVTCRRCGDRITDAEHMDNGGLCGPCSILI